MRVVLGIDGGGTRTRAALVAETGHLLGYGVGGPSNYDDVGVDAAQAAIAQAVAQARAEAGLAAEPFAAAFLGMAGIVSEADRTVITTIAKRLDLAPASQIGVHHDIHIALAGGLLGRPGIALIAGTGSSCYGRNAAGEEWRAGGWGQLIGDEGSGYALGLGALRAAVRAYDGRQQPTMLLDGVMRHLQLPDINDIMHRLYHVGLSRSEIAALAPLVVDSAESGDAVARALLSQGVNDLAACVAAVGARLAMRSSCELVLIGGLLQVETVVKPLKLELQRRLPGIRVQRPLLPPVLGACVCGLEQLRLPITRSVSEAMLAASRGHAEAGANRPG